VKAHAYDTFSENDLKNEGARTAMQCQLAVGIWFSRLDAILRINSIESFSIVSDAILPKLVLVGISLKMIRLMEKRKSSNVLMC
jgi:hypothetical protein